jgi:glyoxylase-like metal-dependent hydrolase (beta-lactamase superfamily II)
MKDSEVAKDSLSFVAEGVYHTKIVLVSAYFVDTPENDSWILVDTGLPMSDGKIQRAAEVRYGENTKPSWRESDRTLLAEDALTTMNLDS